MKEKFKKIVLILLLLFPTIVFAESDYSESGIPIYMAIFMEAFITIHMSVFVLKPLSDMLAKENSKKLFWTLFFIRVGILLFFDIFISTYIAAFDFFCVFLGAFIIVPITALITKVKINMRSNQVIKTTPTSVTQTSTSEVNEVSGIELQCAKCHAVLRVSDKFCPQCGTEISGDNIVVVSKKKSTVQIPKKEVVTPTNFDQMYSLTEDKLLEEFINKEIAKANLDKNANLLPSAILKRKKILNIIFSILIFIFITSYFFHLFNWINTINTFC